MAILTPWHYVSIAVLSTSACPGILKLVLQPFVHKDTHIAVSMSVETEC
jgi:hypothetical protein